MATKKSNNIDQSKIVEFTGKIYGNPRFYDSNSSFGVVVISTQDDVPYAKKTVDYDINSNDTQETRTIVVAGKIPEPDMDAIYKIRGTHKFVEKFKQHQYEIISMISVAPKTVEDCKTYLQSLCTEKQVEAMLSVYPNIVQDIIDGKDEYVDLNLLNGIGDVTWEKIKDKVISNFAIADVINLLVPLGISFNKLKKLLDDESNPQILKEKLLRNPYKICEIKGISFSVADKIAIQLTPSLKESEERLIAFLFYYFEKIGNEKGHTWVNIENIRDEVIENVPELEKFLSIYVEKERIESNKLFIDGHKIGLKKYRDDEMFIWNCVQKLNEATPSSVSAEDIEKGISLAEEEQGFSYTQEQKEVIINMTKNNFTTLRGKAGVGKSCTARGILKIYKSMNLVVKVAAFSAKAAVRAQETTGLESSTIHRLFGLGRGRKTTGIVKCDVLFIDECVLNPLFLMRCIFEGIDLTKTKLILCADVKQLPPLGLGNVFSDITEKEGLNQNELTVVQRQAAESGIIVDANLIRESVSPINFPLTQSKIIRGNKSDLYYIFKEDKEELFRIAVSSFLKSAREKGVENVVILVPFKKKSLNCTNEFNKVIQEEINSENKHVKFIHGEKQFWLNDFVIHTVNNYDKEIFNGFTGFVTKIEGNKLYVTYGENIVEYTHEDIDELELAYSLTTWKYQGSEVKDAIIVIDSGHYILLSSQYLYCSMTRAKERVLILSDNFAFKRCLEEDKSIRQTWIKEI